MKYKYKVGEKIRLFISKNCLYQINKPNDFADVQMTTSEIIAFYKDPKKIAYIVSMPEGMGGFVNSDFNETKDNPALKGRYRMVYEAAIAPFNKVKCTDCI